MNPPPPPPPPHGSNPTGGRTGGLPDGKYDIFVIPPHSAGSGFLYLPSLHTHRNSFLAGAACTAFAFFVYSIAVPAIKEWFHGITSTGGPGVMMLMIGVGIACWAWGKTQGEWASAPAGSGSGGTGTAGGAFGAGQPGSAQPNGSANTSGAPPKTSWQRPNPQTTGSAGAGASAKTSWEKAREETRKKEEERRKTEEAKKRREDAEKARQQQREKDARERAEREKKEKEEKERERQKAASEPAKDRSPPKRPPNPTVRTENEDDAYSFRPYDRPKKPAHKANSAASIYSESSYAPSQTTARTTPPPVHRGPYNTKDPDKIVIKGVYSFNNAFQRTPVAQLISGQGNVTDGLILRITTEGLFIDDDVRGVPQREWDVKAWTMKLAEVRCPHFLEGPTSSGSLRWNVSQHNGIIHNLDDGSLKRLNQTCKKFCHSRVCSGCDLCFSWRTDSVTSSTFSSTVYSGTSSGTDETLTQSGEMMGLHVLRASIRDQEGKKYVFILSQAEGWKVAIGLQRLRRGTQVRALGVSGLPPNETKMLIESLGWT